MVRSNKRTKNSKMQLVKMDFMPLQKVYAKQRGYVHWPSIIIDFHPVKSRVAKVEFFGWNHQWAWISFDNLLLLEAAEHIVEKNIHNVKFAKAYNEMNICKPMIDMNSLGQLSKPSSTSTRSKLKPLKNSIPSDANNLQTTGESKNPIKQITFSPRKTRSNAKSLSNSVVTISKENQTRASMEKFSPRVTRLKSTNSHNVFSLSNFTPSSILIEFSLRATRSKSQSSASNVEKRIDFSQPQDSTLNDKRDDKRNVKRKIDCISVVAPNRSLRPRKM